MWRRFLQMSDPSKEAERLLKEGNLEAAENAYLALTSLQPHSPDLWFTLVELARQQNDDKKAAEYEKRILAIYAAAGLSIREVYAELFTACRQREEKKIRKGLLKALACQTDNATEYSSMATVVSRSDYPRLAILLYRKALHVDPAHRYARNSLARLLQDQGFYEEALKEYREAYRIDPSNTTALWGELLFLPTLYNSAAEMKAWRARWRANLQNLSRTLSLQTPQEIDQAYYAVLFHANFLLAYQGDDLLEDQLAFGELISRIAKAKFPHLTEKRASTPKEKIRVGFISYFLNWHSIFKTHGAWITKLDRSRFEIYSFNLGYVFDAATKKIASHSDRYFQDYHDVAKLIEKIAESDLDVVIYPDIGMYSVSQLLAALKLAPVQCNALGHPITSGLKSIDYALSSALMEPEDAQTHYSEKLVLLPHLASSYPFPATTTAVRPRTLKEKDPKKVIYLNLQNLLKLLPQHDDIFPKLALRVPNAEFHFLATGYEGVRNIFIKRIESAFQAHGLDASRFCFFHPSLPQQEFYGLVEYGDVVLDSLDWSGNNSSMEAIAFDKPVVTMPGSTFRSRHSFGILQRLDCPELIAKSKEEYLDIAAKLSDAKLRSGIALKIHNNKSVLYEDSAPIRALEEFLVSKIASLRKSPL